MSNQSALSIMFVEDQLATRALIRSSLTQLGFYNITECGDGEAALWKLETTRPQLIISDLVMPKLDGLGLLRAIRKRPEFNATPFIMLTASGDSGLVKEAIEIGINGYLVKPFAIGALKKKIEAAMGASL